MQPGLRNVVRRYFSLEHEGAEFLSQGPKLFVANHNGGIAGPDLFCTLSILWDELSPENPLYALAHDFAMKQLTPLGRMIREASGNPATRPSFTRPEPWRATPSSS